jgi:hypothetical protein
LGNLKDHLFVPQVKQPEPSFTLNPTTEYDGNRGFIQTGALKEPPEFEELLKFFGYDPKEVRIAGTLKTSRWQQREDGEWLSSYRFSLAPASVTNIDEIIKAVQSRKPLKSKTDSTGGNPFHWLAGDLQLGKIDGDGTQGIVDRVCESIEKGVIEYKRLRKTRNIGLVHQAWLGDCGEGNQSQGGRNMWRTELTVTEQYRLFRRLMLYAIDCFQPLVERIEVDVVNGNHDDVQRFQNTRADDGHATESAIALADALTLNSAVYGSVKIFVPNKDESMVTREIGSSVFTHLHGHQFGRGKAFQWWSGQALNLHSPTASQFLLHGHEHEFQVHAKKDRVEICVPTFESRSQYWVDRHGDIARTGAVIMVTDGTDFSDLTIV